ncbi:MAG: hypothetical protein ACOX0T_12490 [Pelotomaculum sp.]
MYRRTDQVYDKLYGVVSAGRLFTLVDGKLIIDLGMKPLINENTDRGKNS